jgi:RND family efflux transporter MFP subunit
MISPAPKRNTVIAITTRVVVSLALIAAAAAVFQVLKHTRKQPAMVHQDAAAVQIAVMEAHPVMVRRQWEGFGTARPAPGNAANVPAQVRGIVVDVPRTTVAGAIVERDQVLVTLDPTDFEHEVAIITERIAETEAQLTQLLIELESTQRRLELAESDVQLAQSDLERVERALAVGGATQREVDQLRQVLSAAIRNEIAAREQLERIQPRRHQFEALASQHRAALRLAQRNLDRTTIRSPIDGVLQSVEVEPGEAVHVDQQIARVVNLRRIEVPLRLPASARSHLSAGSEVGLRPARAASNHWQATISRIAPEDDFATRTVTVYVELEQNPGAAHVLAPGQFVHGVVEAARPQERWVVPRRAVQGDRVRLIEDGLVRSRAIAVDFHLRQDLPELGLDEALWAVLREPLPPRALIVLDGTRRLADGLRADAIITNGLSALGSRLSSHEVPQSADSHEDAP